jgi:hypothetical membrane protein
MRSRREKTIRLAAWGGIVGPIAFASAWISGSLRTSGYSMLNDAISRLAAVRADTRVLMTAGFVVFAVGVLTFAHGLRRSLPGRAWLAAAASAVATLGVALLPLDHSSTVDLLHGAAATVGYVTLAATSLLAGSSLRRIGRARAAAVSTAAGVVTALCLAATLLGPKHGLFQRVGVSVGDAWIVGAAVAILQRSSSRRSLIR